MKFTSLMKIKLLPEEDSISDAVVESLVIFDPNTTIAHFQGPGIDWKLPLSRIQYLTTQVDK